MILKFSQITSSFRSFWLSPEGKKFYVNKSSGNEGDTHYQKSKEIISSDPSLREEYKSGNENPVILLLKKGWVKVSGTDTPDMRNVLGIEFWGNFKRGQELVLQAIPYYRGDVLAVFQKSFGQDVKEFDAPFSWFPFWNGQKNVTPKDFKHKKAGKVKKLLLAIEEGDTEYLSKYTDAPVKTWDKLYHEESQPYDNDVNFYGVPETTGKKLL